MKSAGKTMSAIFFTASKTTGCLLTVIVHKMLVFKLLLDGYIRSLSAISMHS